MQPFQEKCISNYDECEHKYQQENAIEQCSQDEEQYIANKKRDERNRG